MSHQPNLNIAELIGKVRDQNELTDHEINCLIDGVTSGEMSDAQVGAFVMAVLCKGMSPANGVMITKAMRDSGRVLSWDVDGPIVDKHSTGGVGDGTSLLLSPILAACGLYVPMISGRGLGHTGGTLDKLESIQGFSTKVSPEQMQKLLVNIGCVIAGQGADIVPADGRLYAIRDVTGAVPSIDLITASILSKKLAAGLGNLVLDVKFGLGAFMKTPDDATRLAKRLVEVANALGCPTTALITDMNTPLASSAGNAVEVHEIVEIFEGSCSGGELLSLTKTLCAELLVCSKTCTTHGEASALVERVLASGLAAEKFEQMSAAQGGATSLNTIKNLLPKARYIKDIMLPFDSSFYGFDAYKLGMAVVGLGGGRQSHTDQIDHSVGLTSLVSAAKTGDVIATIHAKDKFDFERAKDRLLDAMINQPVEKKLILDRVT